MTYWVFVIILKGVLFTGTLTYPSQEECDQAVIDSGFDPVEVSCMKVEVMQ